MKTSRTKVTPVNPARSQSNLPPSPLDAVLLVTFVVVLALEFTALPALGQGTVNFSMTVPGVLSTRVYMPETNYCCWQKYGNTSGQIPPGTQTYSGALVSGSDFAAQLWVAPGANQPENHLVASAVIPFRTGVQAGTVQGSTVTLPTVPADCPVATVQVRVWQAYQYGQWIPSWDLAFGSGFAGPLGKSPLFNVEAIGGGTNPPPNLLNMRSFSLISNLLDSPVTPNIYVQPQHESVPLGGNASFTAEVSCPATLQYTWRFNGTNLISYLSWYWPRTFEFGFPPPTVASGIINASESHDFFYWISQHERNATDQRTAVPSRHLLDAGQERLLPHFCGEFQCRADRRQSRPAHRDARSAPANRAQLGWCFFPPSGNECRRPVHGFARTGRLLTLHEYRFLRPEIFPSAQLIPLARFGFGGQAWRATAHHTAHTMQPGANGHRIVLPPQDSLIQQNDLPRRRFRAT